MSEMTIRPARADEAKDLSALCRRSKAYWGYDAAFMQLSDSSLTVSPELFDHGHVLVAQDGGKAVLGVASIAPLLEPGAFDLVHLFVEPRSIGHGIGRVLFRAVASLAKQAGGDHLVILSDPYAAGFYERLGATQTGNAPSDAIRGRRLPLLRYDLG